MISYGEALEILLQQQKFSPITRSIKDAYGYTAAQNVISTVSVPSFSNSAMDGFAVHSAALANISDKAPLTLSVTGSTVAGDMPTSGAGGAWEIMTGAPIPSGYDTVIKVEDVHVANKNTDGRPTKIVLTQAAQINSNIRNAGEDITTGDLIIKNGTVITPFHVMALGAIGQKKIMVAPKPRVAVLSTGKELVDDADIPLLPGQIRNSNAPYLLAALEEFSVPTHYCGAISDNPQTFAKAIQKTLPENDIIISTGAVSMSKHDFIPNSLVELGAEILFHKVAIRPGKPILYAKFPDGTHYFGLPGNPASTAVGFRFFVVPFLQHLQGMEKEQYMMVPLLEPSSKKGGLRFFRKAQILLTAEKKIQLKILQGQESFKISSLLQSNCWAILTENQNDLGIGEEVKVYPLMPNRWNFGTRT